MKKRSLFVGLFVFSCLTITLWQQFGPKSQDLSELPLWNMVENNNQFYLRIDKSQSGTPNQVTVDNSIIKKIKTEGVAVITLVIGDGRDSNRAVTDCSLITTDVELQKLTIMCSATSGQKYGLILEFFTGNKYNARSF